MLKGVPPPLRNQLPSIIEKFKGRVLNPAVDIHSPKEGEFVVFLDGWASLDLEE